jgi:hypothetical protein
MTRRAHLEPAVMPAMMERGPLVGTRCWHWGCWWRWLTTPSQLPWEGLRVCSMPTMRWRRRWAIPPSLIHQELNALGDRNASTLSPT